MPNLNVVAVSKRYSKSKSKGRQVKPPGRPSKLKKTVTAVVKKEIKKAEETKIYYVTAVNSTAVTNGLYTLSPVQGITQGTGAQGARVGNDIFLQNLTINVLMQSLANVVQTNFRIMVLWADDMYTAGWNFLGGPLNGLVASDFLLTSSNIYNSLPDFKQDINVLYDQQFSIQSFQATTFTTTANTAYNKGQITKKITIPFNGKKVSWTQGSVFFNKKQLYVVIIPNSPDNGITQGVTSVGAIDIQALLSYKDA